MCVKRTASETSTSFFDRTTEKRARFVKNDSSHSMSSNSEVKQREQDGLPSNANTHSVLKSSAPPLSTSPFIPTKDLSAPKRAVSFEDKEPVSVSSLTKKSTPFQLAPRFTLRPNPFVYSPNESFSDDDAVHQLHLLPRRISMADGFNHDAVFLTPRLYPLSSDCLSPPSVPKHDAEEDYIFVLRVPPELMLPVLT